MTKSEQINELAAALSAAQGELGNSVKDSKNPFFKSAYSTLTSVRDSLQAPFTKHGLAVTQLLGNDPHGVTVETVLLHKSGQWLSGCVSVKPIKDDPQALGSAVTYARRYSLSAIAGIASEVDDDGEAAMGRDAQKPRDTKTATPKSTPPLVAPAPAAESFKHKVGDIWTITDGVVESVATPEGKQARVKIVMDSTLYIVAKGESLPKATEKIQADVTMKETSAGAVYYELSNLIPF